MEIRNDGKRPTGFFSTENTLAENYEKVVKTVCKCTSR